MLVRRFLRPYIVRWRESRTIETPGGSLKEEMYSPRATKQCRTIFDEYEGLSPRILLIESPL
jgi:hypothetical protein